MKLWERLDWDLIIVTYAVAMLLIAGILMRLGLIP